MQQIDKKVRRDAVVAEEAQINWPRVGVALVAGVMVYGGIATLYRAAVSAYMYTSQQLQLFADNFSSTFAGVDFRLIGIVLLGVIVVTSKKA